MTYQNSLREQALRNHIILQKQRTRAAALQSQLAALEQDLTSSSQQEQSTTQTLAKAECTQLCAHIMTWLPREIRDMIYSHLSTCRAERITREHFRSTLDPKTKMCSYDVARSRQARYTEHYWDEAYVGPCFHLELIQNYYRSSTFMFGGDAGLIQRFLHTDQFSLGFAPWELVSRIEVHLSSMTYDRTSCAGYMFGVATRPEALVGALEGVDDLKKGASLVVRLETRGRNETEREEQKKVGCKALVGRLRGAIQAGLKVRLGVDGVDVRLDDERWAEAGNVEGV